jgi:antitoxin component of MazEF toxin-antitoxin module
MLFVITCVITTSTAKIRKIGNSKGILFPKSILEESGITDSVKITVKGKVILISAEKPAKRKKWSDFKKVKQRVGLVVNKFDETEWTW